MSKSYQHLCAPNSTNGNPRRLYVVYNQDGSLFNVYDEGYLGIHAIPADVRDQLEDPMLTINITASEYKRVKRLAKGEAA